MVMFIYMVKTSHGIVAILSTGSESTESSTIFVKTFQIRSHTKNMNCRNCIMSGLHGLPTLDQCLGLKIIYKNRHNNLFFTMKINRPPWGTCIWNLKLKLQSNLRYGPENMPPTDGQMDGQTNRKSGWSISLPTLLDGGRRMLSK